MLASAFITISFAPRAGWRDGTSLRESRSCERLAEINPSETLRQVVAVAPRARCYDRRVGYYALAIGVLEFLFVVHAAGRYFVARWCGMHVERFSIGFGPGILKRRSKNGTIFRLALVPVGCFVRIRGMHIAEEVDPDDVHAYPN